MPKELPFHNQLMDSLQEPGSHVMVLNNLSDEEGDVAKRDAIMELLHKRMQEFSEELQKESDKHGVCVSLKTVLLINREKEIDG